MPDKVANVRQSTGTVLIPAYNEADSILGCLEQVVEILHHLPSYTWDVIVVDDGSLDKTAALVQDFADGSPLPVTLIRHKTNVGLGGGLRTGLAATTGDVVVVMDSDLSYSASTLVDLVETWQSSRAHVVVASPYMPGGSTMGVPTAIERRSRIANKLLSISALDDISTLTGMVRAYDGPFIRALPIKAVGPDVNVEILYKTQLLRGRIVEIPAVLDWSGLQSRQGRSRILSRSSRWTTAKSLVMTYLFRPFWFPLVPVLILAPLGLVLLAQGRIGWSGVGIVTVILAVQLTVSSLSMLQSKRYFEETYNHLSLISRRVGEVAERPREE